jgi:hypothetical protein
MDQLKGKSHVLSMTVKVIIVAVIIGVVFYIFYYNTIRGRAIFILSDREIESTSGNDSKTEFNPNSRIYFYVTRKLSNLNGAVLALEIETKNNSDYVHYKRISYEIEKNFKKIHTFIPEEYFKRPGQYRIKLLIDNNLMTSEEFSIND